MNRKYNPDLCHRQSIRLREYDYAQAGAYFVTLCAHDRECLFGAIIDGEVRLNKWGEIVQACWKENPGHFPNVDVDIFVVMPNHVHIILEIASDSTVGATHASPSYPLSLPRGPKRKSIGAIVGSFKSSATRRINKIRNMPGIPVWQRNYYEHIIRDADELNRLHQYIIDNPARWHEDDENPMKEK